MIKKISLLLQALILTMSAKISFAVELPTDLDDTLSDGHSPAISAATENPLKGSCPRGMCCNSPHCGLWQDNNGDSVCDRGV